MESRKYQWIIDQETGQRGKLNFRTKGAELLIYFRERDSHQAIHLLKRTTTEGNKFNKG